MRRSRPQTKSHKLTQNPHRPGRCTHSQSCALPASPHLQMLVEAGPVSAPSEAGRPRLACWLRDGRVAGNRCLLPHRLGSAPGWARRVGRRHPGNRQGNLCHAAPFCR